VLKLFQDVKDAGYKYLEVLEANQIKQEEMKDNTRTEYFRQVKRVLRSKLNGGNMISAINIWAVSLVRYTAGIVNQRKDELEAMDRWTRKLMTTYNSLYPRDDVDRLHVPTKEGGRGL